MTLQRPARLFPIQIQQIPELFFFTDPAFLSNLCCRVTGMNNRHFIRITAIIRWFEVILFSGKKVSGPVIGNQKEQSVVLKYPGICPEV